MIANNLIQFLECHAIPLNAFQRHTRISAWAIRQARMGKRNLPPLQERLIDITIERLRTGKVTLRRVNSQRWELEWVNPPLKPSCPTGALYCTGGLLPRSCPKRWRECGLYANDWGASRKCTLHGHKTKKDVVRLKSAGKEMARPARDFGSNFCVGNGNREHPKRS
jgi:hypothetical protein